LWPGHWWLGFSYSSDFVEFGVITYKKQVMSTGESMEMRRVSVIGFIFLCIVIGTVIGYWFQGKEFANDGKECS